MLRSIVLVPEIRFNRNQLTSSYKEFKPNNHTNEQIVATFEKKVDYVTKTTLSQISGGSRISSPKGEQQPVIWPNFLENSLELTKTGPRREEGDACPKFVYVDSPLQFLLPVMILPTCPGELIGFLVILSSSPERKETIILHRNTFGDDFQFLKVEHYKQ